MSLDKRINEAIQHVREMEIKRKKLADKLHALRDTKLLEKQDGFLEDSLLYPIQKISLEQKIVGVDSGFVDKELSGIDLIFVRGIAAVFQYEHDVLKSAEYHPGFFRFPEPFIETHALERDEFHCRKSLQRLKEELTLAKESIEKFKPDFALLDGSIVLQHADKPRKESIVSNQYHEVIQLFQSLYDAAAENNCILVGCVEDSRGTRFKDLSEKLLQESNALQSFDSSILDFLLKKGERTFAFNYSDQIAKHPILNDYREDTAHSIKAMYLKPSDYDKPLRIEFLCNEAGEALTKKANQIAEMIYALSCEHKEYAYPSPLIEADLHAKLKPQEINLVFDKIMNKLASNKFIQRRDKRPF